MIQRMYTGRVTDHKYPLAMTTMDREAITRLQTILAQWPELKVAYLFGSLANNTANTESDLDLAVMMTGKLDTEQKVALISHLAEDFGRPIDLIDLRQTGQPLLGEIVSKGVMVKGSNHDKGDLLFRSIMMQEDFVPYQKRILEGRRKRWLDG